MKKANLLIAILMAFATVVSACSIGPPQTKQDYNDAISVPVADVQNVGEISKITVESNGLTVYEQSTFVAFEQPAADNFCRCVDVRDYGDRNSYCSINVESNFVTQGKRARDWIIR